jgi:hypothetical protein
MAAPPNGSALLSVSVNVTVTLASCVGWKAIRLTTSFQEVLVVLTTTGICNVYAPNAIQRRGGGFLIHLDHP